MKKNRVWRAIMKVYYMTKIDECVEKAEQAYSKDNVDEWYYWTELSWKYVRKYQTWL